MTRRLLSESEAAAGAEALRVTFTFSRKPAPLLESCLGTEPTADCPPVPTYLCSFLQESDDDRGVAASHCPVEGPHPAVVNVLDHGPVVHQELNLQREARQSVSSAPGRELCVLLVTYNQQKLALLHCLG